MKKTLIKSIKNNFTKLNLKKKTIMSLESNLNEILKNISDEIKGTIGLSVVELSSGMSLASVSNQSGFDLEVAAAYNAEVVKQKIKAKEALGLDNEEIKDFVITLTTQVHIISFITQEYILYLAINNNSNLAMTRIVLNKSGEKLKALIENL